MSWKNINKVSVRIHFKCFKELLNKSGIYDSYVETFELALLSLNDKPIQDLEVEISKFQIHINPKVVETNIIESRLLFIIFSIISLDRFCSSFMKEYSNFYNKEFKGKAKESKLDTLYRNINSWDKSFEIDKYGKNILNYYRHIRNSIVHPKSIKIDIKKELDKVRKLEKPNECTITIFKAPNQKKDICYDDYRLCSYFIKNIAFDICRQTNPNMKSISENCVKNKKIFYAKANRFLNKTDKDGNNDYTRYNKCLDTMLCEKYNLNDSELEKLKKLLDDKFYKL